MIMAYFKCNFVYSLSTLKWIFHIPSPRHKLKQRNAYVLGCTLAFLGSYPRSNTAVNLLYFCYIMNTFSRWANNRFENEIQKHRGNEIRGLAWCNNMWYFHWLVMGFGYCLMVFWLFCFLGFTLSAILTASYTEDESKLGGCPKQFQKKQNSSK